MQTQAIVVAVTVGPTSKEIKDAYKDLQNKKPVILNFGDNEKTWPVKITSILKNSGNLTICGVTDYSTSRINFEKLNGIRVLVSNYDSEHQTGEMTI